MMNQRRKVHGVSTSESESEHARAKESVYKGGLVWQTCVLTNFPLSSSACVFALSTSCCSCVQESIAFLFSPSRVSSFCSASSLAPGHTSRDTGSIYATPYTTYEGMIQVKVWTGLLLYLWRQIVCSHFPMVYGVCKELLT